MSVHHLLKVVASCDSVSIVSNFAIFFFKFFFCFHRNVYSLLVDIGKSLTVSSFF